MRITSTLIHRHDGRPQVVAKGNGKQRTVNYDHAASHDSNHAEAVATLVRALATDDSWVLGDVVESINEGNAVHENFGAKHTWSF